MPLPSHFRIGSVAISNSTYRHPSAQEGKLLSGFTRSARSRVAAGRCLAACYHGHWLKVVRGHVSSLTLYIVLMASKHYRLLHVPQPRAPHMGAVTAAQEVGNCNPLMPCNWLELTAANGIDIPYVGYVELDVTIFGMVVPQRGILVVKEPFRQQASDGIRLAPPLWQRALQHCHRMESQTLQPERGVAKVRGTALLEPLDDCQSLQQGLLISPAMVNIHQGLIQVTGAPSCPKPGSGPQMASGCPTSGQLRPRVTGWTPTSPTYGQPCPQLTVWTTTKTLYPSDSRPAS
uniref:Uncharacterized protein n=1 Tax=Knipowitschia caucasica TaxID=637954 RepID=A0AAV2KYU6_KNICA